MKRPHRRMHLLVWLFLAPAIAISGVLFWLERQSMPFSELPPGIETAEDN